MKILLLVATAILLAMMAIHAENQPPVGKHRAGASALSIEKQSARTFFQPRA